MEYKPEKSTHDLSFNYSTLNAWLTRHVQSEHIERRGSALWLNTFVKLLDYVANPLIEKKNSLLLNELLNQVKALEENTQWLEEVKSRINKHVLECYNLMKVNKSGVLRKDDPTNIHFKEQSKVVEE